MSDFIFINSDFEGITDEKEIEHLQYEAAITEKFVRDNADWYNCRYGAVSVSSVLHDLLDRVERAKLLFGPSNYFFIGAPYATV